MMMLTFFLFVSSTICLYIFDDAPIQRAGMVEYVGRQASILETGRAEGVFNLSRLKGRPNLFGVGAVEGLDGEITIWDSRLLVTRVREQRLEPAEGWNHRAIFLVWAEVARWVDQPIPDEIRTQGQLQQLVRAKATEAGIDPDDPFPFRVTGRVASLEWHVMSIEPMANQLISGALNALRNGFRKRISWWKSWVFTRRPTPACSLRTAQLTRTNRPTRFTCMCVPKTVRG